MIFVLHYILFSSGLSGVVILLALFLQTYSDASLSEIGALLMALPFVSIFVRPFFCALADRQQAHKLYLIGACASMAIGYGSMAVAPFFPDFIREHGRLVWYLDVIGVVIGYSSFSVLFSLGDALALNAARKRGISWSLYRVWSTLSWGVFGFLIGLINETPLLPKYVPCFFVLISSMIIEIVLVSLWNNKRFDMSDAEPPVAANGDKLKPIDEATAAAAGDSSTGDNVQWHDLGGTWSKSRAGTMSGTMGARMNTRIVGAIAEIVVDDIRSSLTLGQSGKQQKRAGLAELLEQHGIANVSSPVVAAAARSPLLARHHQPPAPQPAVDEPNHPVRSEDQLAQASGGPAAVGQRLSSTLGRAALKRATCALSRMSSLGPATGQLACEQLGQQPQQQQQPPKQEDEPIVASAHRIHQQLMLATSLTSADLASSLADKEHTQAAAAAAAAVNGSIKSEQPQQAVNGFAQPPPAGSPITGQRGSIIDECDPTIQREVEKYVDDLQMLLLKLIVKRNRSIVKLLAAFTAFGFLMAVHLSYFFMHVEQICRQNGQDFSRLTGALLASQSVSEIFSFIVVVRYYMPRVGRTGSLLSCAVLFGARYVFYGTYFAELSPYLAMITELFHGLAYGIIYTLITDCASDCVEELDVYLPELISRGLVDPSISASQLKLPLRATMQGVFSGAFDGLGYGLGALFGGIYLDSYDYTHLWQVSAYISAATFVLIVALIRQH